MPSEPPRQYTQQEVSEILRRALARQHTDGAVTHQELVDAAREVGVSDAELHAAAAELDAERTRVDYQAEARRRALGRFVSGVVAFAVVNVLLRTLAVAVAAVAAMPWIWVVIALWGLGLCVQLLRVAFPRGEAERLRRRHERRAAREAERTARAASRAQRRAEQQALGAELAHNAEEFGTAVQRGVSTLLATLAREINARVPQDGATRGGAASGGAAGAAPWTPGADATTNAPSAAASAREGQPAQQESTWVRVNAAEQSAAATAGAEDDAATGQASEQREGAARGSAHASAR